MKIIYKNSDEIRGMRKSNRILARVLSELKTMIEPGIETRELDRYAESRARELGGIPAFKGYRGYPASLCTSVNEEIIHGIPSSRRLREGDIVSLDFGVILDGFYSDAAVTHPVGRVSETALKLIRTAQDAFQAGLGEFRDGRRISDISHAVQVAVEKQGFSVIRAFVGHGIGLSLHEEPQIPNFGTPGFGPKIRPGMTLAIEPMISVGSWEVEILSDRWTAITKDRSLAAHFEHSVALTERGAEILSSMDEEVGIPYAKESVS